jgi:hypothetical protein
MIILFGAHTWRSGHSSFPASRIRSETAPAIAANSPYGHHRAATRQPPFLVKSPSGEPRTASTRKTAALPDRTNCKSLRPNGKGISSEGSPTLATTRPPRISGRRKLVSLSKFAGTKLDSTGPGHPPTIGGLVRPALDARESAIWPRHTNRCCGMQVASAVNRSDYLMDCCRPLRTSGQVGGAWRLCLAQ